MKPETINGNLLYGGNSEEVKYLKSLKLGDVVICTNLPYKDIQVKITDIAKCNNLYSILAIDKNNRRYVFHINNQLEIHQIESALSYLPIFKMVKSKENTIQYFICSGNEKYADKIFINYMTNDIIEYIPEIFDTYVNSYNTILKVLDIYNFYIDTKDLILQELTQLNKEYNMEQEYEKLQELANKEDKENKTRVEQKKSHFFNLIDYLIKFLK